MKREVVWAHVENKGYYNAAKYQSKATTPNQVHCIALYSLPGDACKYRLPWHCIWLFDH